MKPIMLTAALVCSTLFYDKAPTIDTKGTQVKTVNTAPRRIDPEKITAVVHSPILDCDDTSALSCNVHGMLFLNQSDPNIDGDVMADEGGGCLDTSITTTVLAAMLNRSPKLKPSGRTKTLMDLTAPATAANPNATAIKQLSQIYRWSLAYQKEKATLGDKATQAYFFPELLADLAPVKNTGCDPHIFLSCKRITNAAGDTWFATYPSPEINATAIRKLMRDGYIVLLAYKWYVANNSTVDGVPTVTFTPRADHKVVFSGFSQDPAYPFFIANPGKGTKQHAALRYDIQRFTNSAGTAVIFPQGHQLYIDIKENPNVGFIESITVLKINTTI
ncbi:MAG TPA: hypothetical protein VHX14_08580 [Thermoanaerobaculia bacterium]|jgi:hypothetical protein|nr:hypothetical protein [Thermoanaerobaculia bacterium]